MPARRSRLWIIVALAALLALAVWYTGRPTPVPVVVQDIAEGTVESTVANTRAGTVEACQRARLSLAMGGQIALLPVHEGDTVEAGQVLLELWNQDLKAELALAQQEVKAAEARSQEACTTAQVAEKDATRLTRLREQGMVAEESSERAVGEATARRAGCRAAQASARVSQARVDVTEAALERTRLRAPFAGTIAEINGELGEFVTPSPIGIATPPAVDLINNACLYVSAPIDEVDAPSLKPGMEARISLDAFPGQTFPGRLRRVAPYVLDLEKQSRTVDTEVEFLQKESLNRLLAGYSADIEVILATRQAVLRVPTEAVLEGPRVLRFDRASGEIHEQRIETGLANWQWTEVVSGLSVGDTLITSVDREGVVDGAIGEVEGNAKP